MIKLLFIPLLCHHLGYGCNGKQRSRDWLTRQQLYVNLVTPTAGDLQDGMLKNADELIKYFAVDMEDMDNFKHHLQMILIPRVSGTKGNNIVGEHIKKSMEDLRWNVELQSHTDRHNVLKRPIQFNNIIATLDKNAARRLLIACHYDSKMENVLEGVPKNFMAATDSAVPCAQMINLATVMNKELKRLKSKNSEVTLQFVFFDGEEAFKQWSATDSLYGSRNLASVWENEHGFRFKGFPPKGTNTLQRIDLFMLLDLLGTNDPEPTVISTQQSGHQWYKRLQGIEKMLMDNRKKFGILGDTNKRIFTHSGEIAIPKPGLQDDHTPFERKGVPILHVIADPFPRQWHKFGDNIDNVHYATIEKLNKIFRIFVAEYLQLERIN